MASTPQKNPWTSDWITFFRDHRLGFQLQLIKDTYKDSDLYAKGEMVYHLKLPEVFSLSNVAAEDNVGIVSVI